MEHALPLPPPRLVTRISVDFVLRAARPITRSIDRDLACGLAFIALVQVRHARLAARRDCSQVRPTPVYSLANSMRIPGETLRRGVARLVGHGWCRRVARRGVIVNEDALAGPVFAALMQDIRGAFWRMLSDLKGLGFDFERMDRLVDAPMIVEPAAAPPDPGDASFDPLILNFVLRVMDGAITPHDADYVRTIVLGTIMSLNAASFNYDSNEAWRYGTTENPPPDELRRPANLTAIAQSLGLPYETTRRHINALVERGYCARDQNKGIVIPTAVLQRPDMLRVGFEITRRFAQAIAELKRRDFDFSAIPAAFDEAPLRREA